MLSDMSAECRHLLDQLDDDVLRRIALLKLNGHTVDEIAEQLQVARSTIKRKLSRIRGQWEHVEPPHSASSATSVRFRAEE